MIIYGTGEKRIHTNPGRKAICPECKKRSIEFYKFHKYVHLFWIPTFPYGKRSVAVCPDCNVGYDDKNMPANLKMDFQDADAGTKFPIILFSGIIILIVGLALILNLSDGVTTYHYPSGKKQAKGKLLKGNLDGEWIYWHENGNVLAVQNHVNGIEEGEWTWWKEDGSIEKMGNYKNGMSHGYWTFYHDNGEVWVVENYFENRLEGTATYYFENGQKSAEGAYSKNKKIGVWNYWYENGTLSDEGSFKDDNEIGEWISYYENGSKKLLVNYTETSRFIKDYWDKDGNQLVKDGKGFYKTFYASGVKESEGNVKDGLLVGSWTSWFENGKISEKGYYVDDTYFINEIYDESGKKSISNGNGYQKYKYENGVISSEGLYKNGLVHGEWKYRNVSDTLILINNFENGLLQGKSISFFDAGSKATEGNFENDKKTGNWIWYFENGQKESEVSYVKGKKEGEQIFWNESGVIVKRENYKNGELLTEGI